MYAIRSYYVSTWQVSPLARFTAFTRQGWPAPLLRLKPVTRVWVSRVKGAWRCRYCTRMRNNFV